VSVWIFFGSSPLSSGVVAVSEVDVGVGAEEGEGEEEGNGVCVGVGSEGMELVTGSRCVLTSGIISLGCLD
jgi:hypothetical protein